jgi:hypothetical protein
MNRSDSEDDFLHGLDESYHQLEHGRTIAVEACHSICRAHPNPPLTEVTVTSFVFDYPRIPRETQKPRIYLLGS